MKYTNKKLIDAIEENIFSIQIISPLNLGDPKCILKFETKNGGKYEYTFKLNNANIKDITIDSIFKDYEFNEDAKEYLIENKLIEE